MSVSLGRNLIQSMNGQTLTGTRTTSTGYVNGVYTATTAAISVLASVQPVSADDILRIPEGDRERQMWKLYSADELRAANEATKAKPDQLTIDGDLFIVKMVEKWPAYWKALAIKVEAASL